MKLSVEETRDYGLVESILTEPTLFRSAMPDEDIDELEKGKWKVEQNGWRYIALLKDKNPIGIIRFHPVTSICTDTHWHLLPEYWGSMLANRFDGLLIQWFKDNTQYIKMIVQCPNSCRHTIKAAVRRGYEIEGVLVGAIFWRNKIENLVLLARFI